LASSSLTLGTLALFDDVTPAGQKRIGFKPANGCEGPCGWHTRSSRYFAGERSGGAPHTMAGRRNTEG
jgi:hypothetical protein